MKPIDVRTFKRLLHIVDDDFWFSIPNDDFAGQGPYRIAGGAVRAVPLGMRVDTSSRRPVRPLIRDPHFQPGRLFESLDGEPDELEPWNPTGEPDAVLLTFPAEVADAVSFLDNADLWWMVDKVLWLELGLPDPEEEPDPVVHQAPPPARPEQVKTPDMAAAFGRHEVNGWNSDDWKRELSDPATWMKPAWTPSPGKPRPALWNPYLLATEVLKRKESDEEFNRVDRAFADPELQAWQGAWQPYRDQWKGL